MVKFGKNKFKALNKIARNQKVTTNTVSNKVLKKKHNAAKKVTFQKEVLIKEAVSSGNPLVKNLTAKKILNELSNKDTKKKGTVKEPLTKPKLKPVEKQKKRQKTQISDKKLLLSLIMKK